MIQKIKYRLVFNRRNQLNGMGEGLIQIEAYLNGRKIYFTTHTYIRPEHWNGGIVVNHPQASDLNAMLYQEVINMQAIEIDLFKRGITPTLALLKQAVRSKYVPDIGFIEFAEKMVRDSTRRKRGTLDNLRSTIRQLRSFRMTLSFGDLTLQFVREFEKYLIASGASKNTVIKHLHQLRTIVNEAIRQRYIKPEDYPFRDYRMPPMERRKEFLTPEELRRIERYASRPGIKYRRVLHGFLFCCYTGVRFSDFKAMRPEHLVKTEGVTWLCMRMRKTGTDIRLPVSVLFGGKAMQLLEGYDIRMLVRVGSNAEANRKLRAILTKLKIDKRVTWHTARHTFATSLVHQAVPITTIQRLLGHTSVSTTMVYAEVTGDTILQDLATAKKKRK